MLLQLWTVITLSGIASSFTPLQLGYHDVSSTVEPLYRDQSDTDLEDIHTEKNETVHNELSNSLDQMGRIKERFDDLYPYRFTRREEGTTEPYKPTLSIDVSKSGENRLSYLNPHKVLKHRSSSENDNIIFADEDYNSIKGNNLNSDSIPSFKNSQKDIYKLTHNLGDSKTEMFPSYYKCKENINGIEHHTLCKTTEDSIPNNSVDSDENGKSNQLGSENNHGYQGTFNSNDIPISSRKRLLNPTKIPYPNHDVPYQPVPGRGREAKPPHTQTNFPQRSETDGKEIIPNAYIVYIPEGIVSPNTDYTNQRNLILDMQGLTDDNKMIGSVHKQFNQKTTASLIRYGPVGILAFSGMIPFFLPYQHENHSAPRTGTTNTITEVTDNSITSNVNDTNIYVPSSKIITDTYSRHKSVPGKKYINYSEGRRKYDRKQHESLLKLGQLAHLKRSNTENYYPYLSKDSPGDKYLNELVDFIIDVINHRIAMIQKSNVSIPDIDKEFSKRVLGIKVNGEFHGRNGWFRNVSSIYRTADVIVSRSGNILTLQFSVALRTMEFGYDHYEAKVAGIEEDGKITAKVRSNSMSLRVSLTVTSDGKCKVSLDDFKVTELGDIDFDITGLGSLKWLGTKITSWITGKYKEDAIEHIQTEMISHVNAILSRVKC